MSKKKKMDDVKEESVKNETAAADAAIPTLDSDLYLAPYVDSSVERRKKTKRVRKIVLVSIASVLLAVYIGGVIYHSLCFGRATTLNGFDVSMRGADAAYDIIKADMNQYSLDIKFVNDEYTITPTDGVYSIDTEYTMKELIKKQNPFLWVVNIWKPHSFTVAYKTMVDAAALEAYVMEYYDCMKQENMREPKDACVTMYNGEVTIVPETKGSVIDTAAAIEGIQSAITDMKENIDMYESGYYKKADIRTDSEIINNTVDAVEDYLSTKLVYNFKGYEVEISRSDLASMADITENGTVEINKDKVYAFAMDFAKRYTTSYTERKFKTHTGKTIMLYGGYYGWILDGETEAPLLYDALVEGEEFNRQFTCEKEGYTYCDMNDIGYNYVEIDLTNQHVYVYENGKQVYDTPCVSGNVSWGMSTPGGIYPLTYKQKNATLNGPGYSTPVAYWMPFNGGIGMHDATWKSKFGGEIYKTDGSHGCINLPLDAAATIYPYVEQGSPIVCYWEDEVEFVD